ncbi:MAG: hypothetical protein JW833_16155, partial [Prolixibacteraceae bacterium]|nr:hypothetical protein [Prolixibacteraceae bacterium]
GNHIIINEFKIKPSAYYAIHSDEDGIFKSFNINNGIKPFIKELIWYKSKGQPVTSFTGANSAIGIILFQFKSVTQMHNYMKSINKFIQVEIS